MPQGEMVYTTTGEIKSLSKSSLLGFWGKLLICYFILFAITQYIPGFLSRIIPGLTYVYDFEYMGIKDRIEYAILPVFFMAILNGPFRYGISKIHLRQIRERSMESNDLFSGFANFGKSFATYVLMWLIILIVAIPFVAVGTLIVVFLSKSGTALQILGSFLYMIALVAGLIAVIYISVLLAMSFYILVDNPNLKPKEALKASATIMKKNVGRFVVLRLSYLGWIFLASMVSYSISSALMMFLPNNAMIVYLVNVISQIPILLATIYMERGEAFFYEFAIGHLRKTEPQVPAVNML